MIRNHVNLFFIRSSRKLLQLDGKLLQVLVMLHVGGNSIPNLLGALFAVLLLPLREKLFVALGFLLLPTVSKLYSS
jgi:hypothetical protein